MGLAILLFSRSCYRPLSNYLPWSQRLLEPVLLVYYQLPQISPFSVQLLRYQLPYEGLIADLPLRVDCCPELYDDMNHCLNVQAKTRCRSICCRGSR